MTPQKGRRIMVILLCIALLMMLIAWAGFTIADETRESPGAIPVIALILGVILVISGGIVEAIYWVCPHCKAYLGRGSSNFCKHCGKSLGEEAPSDKGDE